METKNIFWLGPILSVGIFLSGCQQLGLKTRSQVEGEKQQTTVDVAPVEEPTDYSEDKKLKGGDFLKSKAPRLGLILGGGGALAYAEIGFLHELEKQKIPLFAITGIEWGAMVAASQAVSNKAHGVEWKLLKLPANQFKSGGGFFGSGAIKVSEFGEFLDKTYGNTRMDDTQIPFTCSFVNIPKETASLIRSGHLKNAVRNCWPYPPHFKLQTVSANLSGVKPLADFLREQGAELIVYVDVTRDNVLLAKAKRQKNPEASSLWTQNKELSDLLKQGVVNDVISLPLSGYQMDSYQSLRSIIRAGQLKSQSLVKKMAKKYGY